MLFLLGCLDVGCSSLDTRTLDTRMPSIIISKPTAWSVSAFGTETRRRALSSFFGGKVPSSFSSICKSQVSSKSFNFSYFETKSGTEESSLGAGSYLGVN